MIDVIKRLAELDSQNPNIVKENLGLDECGPMGMMSPQPSTPASINMTAGSGEELSDMLGAIMKLAGVEKVEPHHLGAEPDQVTLTAEPVMPVGGNTAADDMRSVIDKMHDAGAGDEGGEEGDDDQEETDEGQYDNSPADPTKPKPFKSNEFANQENQPDQGDRMDGNMPKGNPTFEEQLRADYKKFVSESKEDECECDDLGQDECPVHCDDEPKKQAQGKHN